MTQPTDRELLKEVRRAWVKGCDKGGVIHHLCGPMSRVSAALAQPEPQGPTESDLSELFYRHVGEGSEVGFENAIAEALARWGRPSIEPQGPTDEELESFLVDVACQNGNMYHADPMTLARAVLARWGRPIIEPVPVSERPWEREGWCDADGKCALYSPALFFPVSSWILAPAAWAEKFPHIYTHSLPHHALPVPQQEAE
jgi:hypothetical protein